MPWLEAEEKGSGWVSRVGAERSGGEAFGVIEIRACRVVGPGVADVDGVGDGGLETMTVSPSITGLGPDELPVVAGDGKLLSGPSLATRPPPVVIELHDGSGRFRLGAFAKHGPQDSAGLAVGSGQREAGEALADVVLVARVDVLFIAEVEGHGHAGVGQWQGTSPGPRASRRGWPPAGSGFAGLDRARAGRSGTAAPGFPSGCASLR